ncbi:AI-2E family transporter [bacterium]|nr:AI-2E family transporter [bacterium]
MTEEPGRLTGPGRALLSVACFVVIIAGLRAASDIVVPFLLAVFIAIICAPPLFWLQRQGLPRWVCLLLVLLVVVVVLVLLGVLLANSAASFSQSLPEYQARLTEQTGRVIQWLRDRGAPVPDNVTGQYLNPGVAMRLAGSLLSGLSGLLANTFLILLAVVFILLEAANLPDKLRAALPRADNSLAGFREFVAGVNRYLAIKTWVSAATGGCALVLCVVMRVDYPLLWGVLAFLFNYVPSIGSVIAAVPPVLLALIQYGPWPAVVVAGGYLAINVLFGSILEPRLLGGGLGLSTMVVFFSLIFWGWVLGPVGMVLSVPLTMVVKIAMETGDETRWLAVLLGSGQTAS